MWPYVGEPFRVRFVGGVEAGLSGDVDPLAVAGVTVGGGGHPDARMVVLSVVLRRVIASGGRVMTLRCRGG